MVSNSKVGVKPDKVDAGSILTHLDLLMLLITHYYFWV